MSAPGSDAHLAAVAERFAYSAEREFRGASPLYERLALAVADDAELLALAATAPLARQPQLLLFAAVHDLLLGEPDAPLAAHYPDLAAAPAPPADPYPLFRAFCLGRREALADVLAARLVQTNEVRRCVGWLPALGLVARLAGDRPLALVEVGASAGLNLLVDRYAYDYGAGRRLGAPDNPVRLATELRGSQVPPLPATMPDVASRAGIDLQPIDVRDPAAVRWLRACIWPEQRERAALLQRAVAVARESPPALVAGDALDRLPGVIAAIPREVPVCLYHSATLAYFAPAAREAFGELVARRAGERPLFWLSSEGPGPLHESVVAHAREWRRRDEAASAAGKPGLLACHWLVLITFAQGRRTERPLAALGTHGTWLEWLA